MGAVNSLCTGEEGVPKIPLKRSPVRITSFFKGKLSFQSVGSGLLPSVKSFFSDLYSYPKYRHLENVMFIITRF